MGSVGKIEETFFRSHVILYSGDGRWETAGCAVFSPLEKSRLTVQEGLV